MMTMDNFLYDRPMAKYVTYDFVDIPFKGRFSGNPAVMFHSVTGVKTVDKPSLRSVGIDMTIHIEVNIEPTSFKRLMLTYAHEEGALVIVSATHGREQKRLYRPFHPEWGGPPPDPEYIYEDVLVWDKIEESEPLAKELVSNYIDDDHIDFTQKMVMHKCMNLAKRMGGQISLITGEEYFQTDCERWIDMRLLPFISDKKE